MRCTQEHAFDALALTGFLRHLLRMVPGKVLVIWDGAPIHRSKIVKTFLEAAGNARLEIEPLPGYAPDLNPLDTGVWHWLKDVALANVCAADLTELKHELRAAIARLRRKPSVIKASFVAAKLNQSMSRSVIGFLAERKNVSCQRRRIKRGSNQQAFRL